MDDQRKKERQRLKDLLNPAANKKVFVTPAMVSDIERMARIGMYEKDIARALNVTPQYFVDLKRNHPEVGEAVRAGRSKGVDKAVGTIWDAMDSKDERIRVDAAKYYLKTFGDYRDVHTVEHSLKQTSEWVDVPGEMIVEALENSQDDNTSIH